MPVRHHRLHNQQLLKRLGGRVAQERAERGYSRAELAQRSGLSLRFLAQLEAGQANISMQRLDEVAAALELPLTHLLQQRSTSAPQLPPEIAALLEGRTAGEIHEVADWLTARFSTSASRRVALVGLRGAGKSTVGAELADALGVPFFELDSLVEEAAGLSLQEIFELQGQAAFRQLEHLTLVRFLARTPEAVLATGGGIVTAGETFRLLQRSFSTIWLRARAEDHWDRVVQQGDQRPMHGHPAAMQELRTMLAAREALYAQADFTVQTTARPVGEVIEDVCRQLQKSQPQVWPQA
jgi:XRE family aerobic/anaerobic benzoate catabolism transcriptional regulator